MKPTGKEDMLTSLTKNLARFRVPLAMVVTASVAAAMAAPASASNSHRLTAPSAGVAPSTSDRLSGAAGWSGLIPSQITRNAARPTYTLTSSTVRIKTSRGLFRRESISANRGGFAPSPSIVLSLWRHTGAPVPLAASRKGPSREPKLSSRNGRPAQKAENVWSIGRLPDSTFSVKRGNATIGFTHIQVGPFGQLFGSFTHATRTRETCKTSGSEYLYTGIFKVHERFKTKNRLERVSNLGWVHGPTGQGGAITFPHSKTNTTQLVVDNGCVNANSRAHAAKPYCQTGTVWNSPFVNMGGSFQGFSGEDFTIHTPQPFSLYSLLASRYTTITGLPARGGYHGPVTFTRTDTVIDTSPKQSYTLVPGSSGAEEETITTAGSDTYMQGSAVVTSAGSTNQDVGTCYVGKTTNESQFIRSSAAPNTWTNGSVKLKAKSAVGGKIVVGDKTSDTTASIQHYTTQIG